VLRWLAVAASGRVIQIALRTSVVVGTALNLVNQWYGIFYDWKAIHWIPFWLNYCVPYLVASYGAASMAVASDPARTAHHGRVTDADRDRR
jgi:hypothetical protein